MLKEALAGFPTRPLFYLSTVVLVAGLGYHFATTYQSCRSHAVLRETLWRAVESAANGNDSLRLARITEFPWDRAEILVNYKPGGRPGDCPFQWDWSREEREELIAADALTVVVFVRNGKLVDYLETRRDRVEFVGVTNPYTPETAVFRVTPAAKKSEGFILTPSL
jgi:hypothetical protein